jgi:hypothetical protein
MTRQNCQRLKSDNNDRSNVHQYLDINNKSRTEAHNIKNQNASRLTRTIIVQESLNDPKEVELNSTIVLNLVDNSLND